MHLPMYPPGKTLTEREDNEGRKLALTLVPPSFSLTERGYWFLCLYGGSWMKLAWLMTVAIGIQYGPLMCSHRLRFN